jgi:palmitoyl transferase
MMPALRSLTFCAAFACALPAHAACSDLWDWFDKGCRRVADTWRDGNDEILLSGYSWHIPATWTPERRAELNDNAWGGGYGRTVEDPDGDTHTVFYLGFLDSHRNWESNLGYAWSTYWGARDSVQVGLGYTAMLVQRPDIAAGVPFPAVLPLLSFRYQQANLVMTYIPTLGGGVNHGSTLYVFGRFTLDTKYNR